MAQRKNVKYLSVVAGLPLGMINDAIKEIAKTRKVLKKKRVGIKQLFAVKKDGRSLRMY